MFSAHLGPRVAGCVARGHLMEQDLDTEGKVGLWYQPQLRPFLLASPSQHSHAPQRQSLYFSSALHSVGFRGSSEGEGRWNSWQNWKGKQG